MAPESGTGLKTLEGLLDQNTGRFAVFISGFGIYPLERDDDDREVCPAVVFPDCPLQPHHPSLLLPRACVPEASLTELHRANLVGELDHEAHVAVDLKNLSLSFGEVSGLGAEVRRRPETEDGMFDGPPPVMVPDFNLIADAGTYIYRIVAGNRYGLSTPLNTAGVAVVAGDGVTFTITDGGQGTTFYEIYRTAPGAAVGTARLMRRVARTGASQVITDLNADLPGTSQGFVLMQNQRSFSWSQLLPMTRIPLAAIDTSVRWAQVLYGAVKMYTPAKNIVVKNIGRAPGSLPSA